MTYGLLEQPSSPKKYMSECLSLWDQPDWLNIAEEFNPITFTSIRVTMVG